MPENDDDIMGETERLRLWPVTGGLPVRQPGMLYGYRSLPAMTSEQFAELWTGQMARRLIADVRGRMTLVTNAMAALEDLVKRVCRCRARRQVVVARHRRGCPYRQQAISLAVCVAAYRKGRPLPPVRRDRRREQLLRVKQWADNCTGLRGLMGLRVRRTGQHAAVSGRMRGGS